MKDNGGRAREVERKRKIDRETRHGGENKPNRQRGRERERISRKYYERKRRSEEQ